jgi:cephalosporin-C deacetylase-like acetyl esterase
MKYYILLLLTGAFLNSQAQSVWDLKALNNKPKFHWINSDTAKVRELIYEGLPYHNLPTTDVFAYYATPGTLSGNTANDKNLPVVVLVHGGAGKAFKEWATLWAKRGYAAIAMDLAGHGVDGKRMERGGPDQGNIGKFLTIDSAQNTQWTYHSVANVILAHSLVNSFKEVDVSRSAITGISWGGYLTCIVAGLDNRFKVAVPVYGCGFISDGDGYFANNFKFMTPESKARWNQMYDPSQYIGKAKMPILWVDGAQDNFYQPTILSKTYNLVCKQSNFRILSTMPHSHTSGWAPKEIGVFIDHYLLGTPNLPVITKMETSANAIKAEVKTASKIVSADLFYTTDNTIPFKNRVWKSIPAKVNGTTITSELPPAGATIYLLNYKDELGNIMSSEYVFPK